MRLKRNLLLCLKKEKLKFKENIGCNTKNNKQNLKKTFKKNVNGKLKKPKTN